VNKYSALEGIFYFCLLHSPWAVSMSKECTSPLLAMHFQTGIRKPSLDRSLCVNFTVLFAHETRYVLRYHLSLFRNSCFFFTFNPDIFRSLLFRNIRNNTKKRHNRELQAGLAPLAFMLQNFLVQVYVLCTLSICMVQLCTKFDGDN
jgi:hypothetical protein